ncbi:unnamed protein product [Amaranthus hypochondriacus]
MAMPLLVGCSNCRTPLQLPHGATSIRCVICHAITPIAAPCTLPPPHSYYPPPCAPYFQGGDPNGRKKALIIGISYNYSRSELKLKGCINDAKCMKFLLVNRFKFPEDEILMLTEEEEGPYRIPTIENIRMGMAWLVAGCRPGDSLVFYYSGHGAQQRNYNGDELDGFDETLCPLDFETRGMIVDDEINETIVRPLPRGAKLHAIIDACHSGTMLDLPFLCRMNWSGQYVWEDHRPRSGRWKGTNGGEVISFSGCDDNQISLDTMALSKVTLTGTMTYCFIQAIERGQASTYGSILNAMRASIRNTGSTVGGSSVIQEPQLTSNEYFDVYTKPFSL